MFSIDTLLESFTAEDFIAEEEKKPSKKRVLSKEEFLKLIQYRANNPDWKKKIPKDERLTADQVQKLLKGNSKYSDAEVERKWKERMHMSDEEFKKSLDEPDEEPDLDIEYHSDAEEDKIRNSKFSDPVMAKASYNRLKKCIINFAKAIAGKDFNSYDPDAEVTEKKREENFKKYRKELLDCIHSMETSKNTALKLDLIDFDRLKRILKDNEVPEKRHRDWNAEDENKGWNDEDVNDKHVYEPDESTKYIRDLFNVLKAGKIGSNKDIQELSQLAADFVGDNNSKKKYFKQLFDKTAEENSNRDDKSVGKGQFGSELARHEAIYRNAADEKEGRLLKRERDLDKIYRDASKKRDEIIRKHYGGFEDEPEEEKPKVAPKKAEPPKPTQIYSRDIGAMGHSKLSNLNNKYTIKEFSRSNPYKLPNGDLIKGVKPLVKHWAALGIPQKGQIEIVIERGNGLGVTGKPILMINFPHEDGGGKGFFTIPLNDLIDASRGGIATASSDYKGYTKNLTGNRVSNRLLKAGQITPEEFHRYDKFREDMANSSVETK